MNKYMLTLIGAAAITNGSVLANGSQCETQEHNYKQCDTQVGWYIGADVGSANTNVNKTDVERFFQQSNLSASEVKVDDSDTAWSAFAGYQFNTFLALELGYLDLGARSVEYVGNTADRTSFFDNSEHIFPQSAKGMTINAVASYPIAEDFKVSAKLGYFDWRGKYRTTDTTRLVGGDKISDQDLWLGAELNYRFADNLQAYASFSRIKLSRDKNNLFTLGLRYYFGAEPYQRTTSVKTEPVVKSELVAQQTVLDSDKDGVIDSLDKCADSDPRYLVDDDGCTVMTEQIAEFSMVVRYANDSSEIAPEYYEKIAQLAEFVNTYKVQQLNVTGHTSAPGPKAYNQKLSEQRAQSVATMLIDKYGIAAEVLNPIGKGETQLLEAGDNEQAHELNRRIEISLKEKLMQPVEK